GREPARHRVHEVGLAPAAEPGLGVGRQVLRIEDADRRLERRAAGGQRALGRALGRLVAGEAAPGVVDHLAVREVGRVRGDRRRGQRIGPRQQPEDESGDRQDEGDRRLGLARRQPHCLGRRYLSWQPLQLPPSVFIAPTKAASSVTAAIAVAAAWASFIAWSKPARSVQISGLARESPPPLPSGKSPWASFSFSRMVVAFFFTTAASNGASFTAIARSGLKDSCTVSIASWRWCAGSSAARPAPHAPARTIEKP